jgi:hypothetical protein
MIRRHNSGIMIQTWEPFAGLLLVGLLAVWGLSRAFWWFSRPVLSCCWGFASYKGSTLFRAKSTSSTHHDDLGCGQIFSTFLVRKGKHDQVDCCSSTVRPARRPTLVLVHFQVIDPIQTKSHGKIICKTASWWCLESTVLEWYFKERIDFLRTWYATEYEKQ